jgi:hypothetical protein
MQSTPQNPLVTHYTGTQSNYRKITASPFWGTTLKTILKFVIPLGACAITNIAAAQPLDQKTNLFEHADMKHYATDMLFPTGETVMAGTIFKYTVVSGGTAAVINDPGIHVLLMDNDGNTMISNIFNDYGYDERVVGVHYVNGNDITVVASRADNTGTLSKGIEILRLDGGGNQMNNFIYNDGFNDIYPLGTLLYDPTTLYICGYQTSAMMPGFVPSFQTSKEAFVIKYNLATNEIEERKTYNWSSLWATDDYDIAHRMKKINTPVSGIWVGGSCGDDLDEAMMNMIISTATLDPIPTFDQPLRPSISDPMTKQSSYDIIEDLDGAGYSYVFGNMFHPYNTATGMEPFPTFVTITSINAYTMMAPITGKNSWFYAGFDYEWGVATMPGRYGGSVAYSGFQENRDCNVTDPTSKSNINPFISEVTLQTSGSGDIQVIRNFWNVLLSKYGTGYWALNNSYYLLGESGSNRLWNPLSVAQDFRSRDFILSAPVWNPSTQNLNIKYIRTNDIGEMYGCPFVPICDNTFYTYRTNNMAAASTATYGARTPAKQLLPQTFMMPDAILDCSAGFKPAGENSPTSINNINEPTTDVSSISIFPNPATREIQIILNKGIKSGVIVKAIMTDILGKTIVTLYNGPANEINHQIQLPNLSSGIYLIHLYYDEQSVKKLPLTIR